MYDTLTLLQAIQAEAFKKGVHSFSINSWQTKWDGELIKKIYVSVFRTDSGEDEEYYYEEIRQGDDAAEKIEGIKKFVGM